MPISARTLWKRLGQSRVWSIWWMAPVLATLIWAVQGGVQDPKLDRTDTQIALKGMYLFQFAKGNDWPSSVKSGPFVVAIHGKPALVENLAQKYAAAAIGSQSLRIESVENAGMWGMPMCSTPKPPDRSWTAF